MRIPLLLSLALLVAGFAWSPLRAEVPLIYSRTVVRIVPAMPGAGKQQPEEKGKADDKKAFDSRTADLMPSLQRVAKEFAVEVRPISFLSQRDFIAHQPFTDKEGMMMVIDPPAKVPLQSSNLLGRVDVLFVLEDGTVDKIAPEIALNELSEPLMSDKPVRAFIFLKSGMALGSDVKPGDRVDNPLFKTRPVILQ